MYILKNVNVIPMHEEKVIYKQDVLVEAGMISRIADEIHMGNVEEIDLGGKYLMPGLADMHTHFISTDHFNLFLANGVTTVRNMWGTKRILEWKKAIEKKELMGPNIFTTSPLMDGLEFWVGAELVRTPEEAENAVMRAKDEGYDTIKTYPDIPREAFIKLMRVAKEQGMKVVGHPDRNVSVDELIELGYHSIEHATMLPKNDEGVIKLAKSGMWFSPTLTVVWALVHFAKEGKDVRSIDYYEYVNSKEQEDWDAMIKMMSNIPKFKEMDIENILQLTKLYVKNSENILLGTDNTNPGVVAGFAIHEELELNVKDLGFTPYEALRTGTVNAARYLNLLNEMGTVEQGKRADLLVLDDNPLVDISNIRKIHAVIKDGRVLLKNELDQMLRDVLAIPLESIEFALGNNELNEVK